MKKTLGLLALTVAVSSVSLAEQDFVKSLSLDVQGANQFEANQDSLVKTGKRTKLKFIKTVAGTVVLSDEAGLEADFSLGHVDEFNRDAAVAVPAAPAGVNGHGRSNLSVEPKLALRKDVKLGNLDTTLKVGYEGKIERATVAAPATPTNVYTNTFYFQPSFKVVGVSVEPKLVYSLHDTKNSDIALSDSEKHKVWGVDLNLSYGNTLAEGKYGKVEYSVSLNNKYRRLASELKEANNVTINNDPAKNSMYKVTLNPSVTYTTPDFVGFTGSVTVSDQLSKVVGSNTYGNGFKVELNANYKKEVETAVGKVVIKPYVSYNLIDVDTTKVANMNNNGKELKTGLKVSLEK